MRPSRKNIVKGAAWARRRRGAKAIDLLTDDYAKTLHKQMFGEVWKWAGAYRSTSSISVSRRSGFRRISRHAR